MSHQPERKEKDCLNCGAVVQGRFCQVCGQENIVPHQSFGHLVQHFIFDIFHFDGKFFDTLRKLMFRPGRVPADYIRGKRVHYLDPIRMYLFSSALFFLVFFTVVDPKNTFKINQNDTTFTNQDRREMIAEYQQELKKHPGDSAILRKITLLADSSRPLTVEQIYELNESNFVNLSDRHYRSPEEYDSVQKALPPGEKDGWLKRQMVHRSIVTNNKYRGNWKAGTQELSGIFMHNLPYLLFLSLPFFALILKLLYVRRKQVFYSDHLIFSLYHYIFTLILLLGIIGLYLLAGWTHLSFFKKLMVPLLLAAALYLFLSMKNFYRQGWLKTSLKFVLQVVLSGTVLLFLLFAFFLISIFQI